jgi:hypothetical protein
MRKRFLAAVVFVLAAGGVVRASDPVGVYAIIDRVVLEPNERAPERVRLSGAFALADPSVPGADNYFPAVRGLLYYRASKRDLHVCRIEWADLKRVAGTGQCVAFGGRHQPLGVVRQPKPPRGQAAHVGAAQLARWVADLDSREFAVRQKATDELARAGKAAEPALRALLAEHPSAEARRRAEHLLHGDEPDVYPVGSGLYRIGARTTFATVAALRQLPGIAAPADAVTVEPGRVTLVARNVLDADHAQARYVFEIRGPAGAKEKSDPVEPGDKRTAWTPEMKVRPGAAYTWRVWAVDGTWQSPAVGTFFQGKSAP